MHDLIPGEDDYKAYYQGLIMELETIQVESTPRHFSMKSQMYRDLAYSFNLAVPAIAPAFFYDKSQPLDDGWVLHDSESWKQLLPEEMVEELPDAMINGLFRTLEQYGSGPDTRYLESPKGTGMIVSARLVTMVTVDSLKDVPSYNQR